MSRIFSLALLILLLAAPRLLAGMQFPIGEEAHYKIRWGLITCGTSTFRCDEVDWDGKRMIRVRVQAKSNWLVSTLYPVDDTVDCYIDPETGLSVRVEKNTSEGDKICRDILELDRENNMARWTSTSDNISTNYPIEAGASDAISFLYEFRQQHFDPSETKSFNIVVDTALHGIKINGGKTDTKNIESIGKIQCRRYTVEPRRADLFVRKIPKEIWIAENGHKILVRMDLQVPVGRARIMLDKYIPPKPLP